MMIARPLAHCDCCGLPISGAMGQSCPRCGYPITQPEEGKFLESSLLALQRVAAYGGANITVSQLINRYRTRLNYLHQPMPAGSVTQSPAPVELPASAAPLLANQSAYAPEFTPSMVPPQPPVVPPNPVPVQSIQPAPMRSFSLASFLEEQTINIVASLGAFLILVGALSFVATTTNLLLSFLVIFIVHAIFGSIGIISFRFRSFRTVAAIYTAIFALLVPLVGFSAYRLVSGNMVQFSTAALIASAAIYAALVYGALAVYQKFSPFAYLAALALLLAILATSSALGLSSWWWPSVMMLFALPALLSVPRSPGVVHPFVAPWTILREPVRAFMGVCVAVCIVSIPTVFVYSLIFYPTGHTVLELRSSLTCMLLLLLAWNCLFVWRTQRTIQAQTLPYLFLFCALAFSYTLSFKLVGYVLVLVCVAWLYHGITRFAPRLLRLFKETGLHLEGLALLLVALIPFIVVPLLPFTLVAHVYMHEAYTPPFSRGLVVELIAIIAGMLLTVSVVLKHTGLRRVPNAWCWLLLFSGFLLNTAYGLFIVLINAEPVWLLLGLALVLLAAAVAVRRFISAQWAHPLDILALVEIVWMLLFSFNLAINNILLLWLSIAALLYVVVLYQRRAYALFLPLFFAVLITPILLNRPLVLLFAGISLPLVAVAIHRLITTKWNVSSTNLSLHKNTVWEWPLLALAAFYGAVLGLYDTSFASASIGALPASTIEGWLHIHFPVSLELAAIAVFWYASAVLARVKWWSLAVVGFALAALLVPGNPFWILAWLAPVLVLLALGVSRLAGRGWALSLYTVALCAAVVMGVAGYTQGQLPTAAWVLLAFSVLIYLIGVIEQSQLPLWLASIFAIWSVFYSGQSGDLYRSPIVALACAVLGIGIACLHFIVPALSAGTWKVGHLRYSLPLYVTACAAAVLTGVYGTLAGVNYPFFAAIPTAMFVYALVAYGVLLFERSARWQWLVLAFALWGVLLLPQATSCVGTLTASHLCNTQNVLYYLVGVILSAGIVSFLAGFIARRILPSVTGTHMQAARERFRWNWSWYLVTFIALLTVLVWSYSVNLPSNMLVGMLGLLIGFTLILTLLERVPELLLVPIALTLWMIFQIQWPLWQQMSAYSLLFVLVFAAQFVWRALKPAIRFVSPARLYQALSIGGQVIVILTIILQGGLSASSGILAHVGAAALFVLAALIFCYGLLDFDASVKRLCNYSAGLLCSLVFSWELAAFGQTQLDWLTLAPAVYLIVASPFLSRDHVLARHQRWGRVAAFMGAALLLLPMLWISFSESNLTPTLILAGEALALLLLGIITRIRLFVLSGAALTIVGAMHALFLPSLGIPTSLALAILGIALLAIATGLSLSRRRIQSVWTEWQ